MALPHGQLVAVLDGAADLVDVGEVDLGVDALAEQVHAQGHEVDVAGALAVAEQAALDAVGAGEVAELCRGDARAAVVVRVQRDHDRLAPVQVADHPLDRVRVDVGRGHLHRRGQVDDHLVVRRRVDDVDDLVADPHREVELGAGVGLRRVLVVDVRLGDGLLELAAQAGALERDVDDAVLVETEHHAPLQHRRRVVEVHDRLLGAADGVEGPLDEVVPALGQHLDRHVVGDVVALDELAHEVVVGLARRGEADLDLLVAHAHQQVEHPLLPVRAHRVDEGLVAVTEVDGAPAGRLGDDLGRPGALREVDRDLVLEGHVLRYRHTGRLLRVDHRLALRLAALSCSAWATRTPRRGAADRSGPAAAAKKQAHVMHTARVCREAGTRPPRGTPRSRSGPGHP